MINAQHPTFLMLDIKGSTQIAQALPREEYLRRVGEPVYAKLAKLFAEHGGEMSGDPQGDNALVVFGNVNQAIQCAVTIQKQLPLLVTADANEKVRQLQVRIALHRAETEILPEPNGRYPNHLQVIYVARLLQYVEGGQIVASEETRKRADPAQWNWKQWGERYIAKWDEAAHELNELLYDGWESKEPGIRFRPEWFRETNKYISRPALEQQIAALFARKTGNGTPYRLVTLHDFGGMGKTRLAVQVCLNSVGLFEGRLVFARLDSISDKMLQNGEKRRDYLARQIAAAFGVEGKAATPKNLPSSLVIEKQTLLLLDNFETVAGEESAGLISEILRHCPLLTILATGREKVGVHNGEQELDKLSFQANEAFQLFVTRVQEQKVGSNWQPDAVERQAIASIVEDTARIPLAVELVAAHFPYTPLPTIAAELHRELYGERTALPEGVYSDDPTGRHKTLEKCYDWSWKLLSEPARQALMRLSLFADNALETEIQACFPETEGKALVQLQNAALLLRSEENHKSQYTLLNPTREYARKRLKEFDAEQKIQRHFVAYYLQLVVENHVKNNQEIAVHLDPIEQAWRHALRAAELAADMQDIRSCVEIANMLAEFLVGRTAKTEALPLYDKILNMCRQYLPKEHLITAQNLSNLALLYNFQGHYRKAKQYSTEALAIVRHNLPKGHRAVAQVLNNLASIYKAQGEYDEAETLLKEALEIIRQLPSAYQDEMPNALNGLGSVLNEKGKIYEAVALYEEALKIQQVTLPAGHPSIANSLNNLGELYREQHHYIEAEAKLKEALLIRSVVLPTDHPETSNTLNNLAMLYYDQGRYIEAEGYFNDALEMRHHTLPKGHPFIAQSINNLGGLYRVTERYNKSETLLKEAMVMRRQVYPANHPEIANSLMNLAWLYKAQRRYSEMEPLYKEAIFILEHSLGVLHPSTKKLNNEIKTFLKSKRK